MKCVSLPFRYREKIIFCVKFREINFFILSNTDIPIHVYYPNNNKWMSLCVLLFFFSKTSTPILMKLCMWSRHVLRKVLKYFPENSIHKQKKFINSQMAQYSLWKMGRAAALFSEFLTKHGLYTFFSGPLENKGWLWPFFWKACPILFFLRLGNGTRKQK